MEKPVRLEVTYDPSITRWRALCPVCGYTAVRAKREAAEHAASQHVNYTHEREVAR